MLDERVDCRKQAAELREVLTDVMSRVIEGTASPFALIRRSDLARLKQAVEREDV